MLLLELETDRKMHVKFAAAAKNTLKRTVKTPSITTTAKIHSVKPPERWVTLTLTTIRHLQPHGCFPAPACRVDGNLWV